MSSLKNILINSINATVVTSHSDSDPVWDAFVASHPGGQYPQTSSWAHVKDLEGWLVTRVYVRDNEKILGGFQILFKTSSRFGKIGYLPKGPLFAFPSAGDVAAIKRLLDDCVRCNRIKLLIIQPPDTDGFETVLKRMASRKNYVYRAINATVLVDVTKSIEDLLNDLRKQRRQDIRKSQASGLVLKEGGEGDLVVFYDLMKATAQRQNKSVSPARIDVLKELWKTFYPNGMIRLFLAKMGPEVVTSLLVIIFNKRVIYYKMGWNGEHEECRPNHFLLWEVILWAQRNGFEKVDIYDIDTEAARCIKEGRPIPERIKKTPTLFKLGFGGEVTLLHDAVVYIPNFALRFFYTQVFRVLEKFPAVRRRILSKFRE